MEVPAIEVDTVADDDGDGDRDVDVDDSQRGKWLSMSMYFD